MALGHSTLRLRIYVNNACSVAEYAAQNLSLMIQHHAQAIVPWHTVSASKSTNTLVPYFSYSCIATISDTLNFKRTVMAPYF